MAKSVENSIEITRKKKPFYLRWWFILLVVIVVLVVAGSIGNLGEKIAWEDIVLGEMLPEPPNDRGEIYSNNAESLRIDIEGVSAKEYEEYKKACIDAKYTIDFKEIGDRYSAFNADGFELVLSFYEYNEKLDITLQAPEELKEFAWPANGLAAKLPIPASKKAKVKTDSSTCFMVLVGNTNIDEYNKYVSACEQKGFVVDYNKQERSFSANNQEGYRLNLSYVGCDRINIMIQTPKQETIEKPEQEVIETPSSSDDSTITSNGIDPDFKAAMDSYEKFMNDYVEFMKKYKANPTDLGLLADYTEFMNDYDEYVKDFEKWDDDDLNTEELSYYTEVQARVSKKLLEIAQ